MFDQTSNRSEVMPVHAVIQKNDGELCQVLRERIIAYKKAHPRLSSQQIAKRFNMASSTLGRIENMDIKNPSLDQVVRILKGTGNLDELLEFLEKFYPEIADAYCSFYRKAGVVWSDKKFEELIKQKSYFKILLILSTVPLTAAEIEFEFGAGAKKKLDELIDYGVIKFDNKSEKYLVSDKELYISDSTTVSLLADSIREFSLDYNSADLSRYVGFDTFNVDLELAAPEIRKILSRARSEIFDLLMTDKYKGNDALVIGLLSDCFYKGNAK